jgi:hypothetical protein
LAFCYQLFAGAPPIEMDKPHILAYAAEADFSDLKSKFPLYLKIKCQLFNAKGRPFE